MPNNYFVDSTTGSDADSGLTMDLAWATLKKAVTAGALTADDKVWVRRTHSEANPGANIVPPYNGNSGAFIKVYGWPRNSHAIASSDWTNGNTTVVVDDADMDYEKHACRFVTAPDGNDYLITEVTDASHIVIDREYPGPTIANQPATIKADDYYDVAQAIDDTGWTINKAAWNADADDIATIDLGATGYCFYPYAKWYWEYANLYFKSTSTFAFVVRNCPYWLFTGCMFYTSANTSIFFYYQNVYFGAMDRFIIKGSGAGASQRGLDLGFSHSNLKLKNGAIHNCGSYGLFESSGRMHVEAENLNIGVENPNGNYDIYNANPGSHFMGKDVKLGLAVGAITPYPLAHVDTAVDISNYQKILGTHKRWRWMGEVTKTPVQIGAGDPEKRPGGADAVYDILYNGQPTLPEKFFLLSPIFVHEFDAGTESKNYRYYVQSVGALTASQLYIVCEYVVAYDDDSEYIYGQQVSDENISARTGPSDWSQYIEVTGVAPAAASRVKITCYLKYYHATNKIYIDPGDFKYLPISLPLIDYPMVGDVEKDVAFDFGAKIGTFKSPDETDVEDGVQYGADDIEFEGTLKVPAEPDVRDGEDYGGGGAEYQGQLDLPLEADVEKGVQYDSLTKTGTFKKPDEADVEKGVQYGANDVEFTGTFKRPLEPDVREGSQYGANDIEFTGVLDLPVEADVEKGVKYDSLTKEGTVELPIEDNVRKPIDYGADGTEFTGKATVPAKADVREGVDVDVLDIGELDLPDVGDVEKGVQFDSLTKTGTFKPPIENDVRKGTQYGKDDVEFTGKTEVPDKADVREGIDVDVSDVGELDLPAVGDVEEDVKFDNLTKTGTFEVPPIAKVEKNYGYGEDGTEFVGTMTPTSLFTANAKGLLAKETNIKGLLAKKINFKGKARKV